MGTGLLKGGLLGTVAAGLGLVTLSYMDLRKSSEIHANVEPMLEASPIEVAPVAEAVPDTAPVTESVSEVPTAPSVTTPAGESIAAESPTDDATTPPLAETAVAQPENVNADANPVTPDPFAGEEVEMAVPQPAQENPESDAQPDPEPARQPVEVTDELGAPSAPGNGDDAPALGTQSVEPGVSELTDSPDLPGMETRPDAQTGPDAPDSGGAVEDTITSPGEDNVAALAAESDPQTPTDMPDLEANSQQGEAAPDAGQEPEQTEPSAELPEQRTAQVTINRLPRISTEPDAEPIEEAAVEEIAEIDPNTGALERNASVFENPQDRPLMGLLLRHVGGDQSGLGDLQNLPFPVSFLVDAAADDAGDAIEFYRAAGAEVVLVVPLPAGAEPTDVEVTYQAYDSLLGEVVAVMPRADSGFQASGTIARQIAEVLAGSGHGLISLPQGLNTGHKNALKAGVPAGLVFRDLDSDGQSPAVMRRFMDNAAFKARQEKSVIMMGHARAETVQALVEWSLGNRAKSVALAPLSAVLLDQ